MTRSHHLRVLLIALATTLVVGVAPAVAAKPAWRMLAVTAPTNLEHHGHAQTITVNATGGTFNVTFDGQTTPDLAHNASPLVLQAALNDLSSIEASGGSVKVVGGPVSPDGVYRVRFEGGSFSGNEVAALSSASGSTPLSGTVTTAIEPSGMLVAHPSNVGAAATSGTITVTVGPLPAGIETAAAANGVGWSCPGAAAGQTTVTCERSDSMPAMYAAFRPISVPLRVNDDAATESTVAVSVAGGGADPEGADTVLAAISLSEQDAEPGIAAFWAGAFDADGVAFTQAGGHPHSAATMFLVNTILATNGKIVPAGDPRDVIVDLPAGFVGNPLVSPRCPQTRFGCASHSDSDLVQPETSVGRVGPIAEKGIDSGVNQGELRVSNDEPPRGYAARLTFPIIDSRVSVFASLRSDTDFGVRTVAPNITTTYKLFGSFVALHGVPVGSSGKAFLTNKTDCTTGPVTTFMSASTWQNAALFSDPFGSDSPPVSGCSLVPFDPAVDVTPSSTVRDSASGLDFDLELPQENLVDPNAIATSHLKKTVVKLPEGFSVNPSAATGLKGCSDAQVGLHSKSEPSCPDASKLGTVKVTSPLVDQPLEGVLYLGTPKSTDPMSGEMLRLFLVVRNDRYGLLVKLPGSTTADPATGQLTATFDENPRLPFDHLQVKLRGGDRGVLATGQDCGQVSTSTVLSPWSGTDDVTRDTPTTLTGPDCSPAFAPKLSAGMSTSKARSNGAFSFKFSRQDGEQWIDGLTAQLPKGLLASVKDVPLCSDGQAAAGACPAASRIGSVDATAGAGDPFVLEQKGSAYLTEGYKGCAYGLAVVVPVIAGPFDGTSPETDLGDIVVRQAVCVDRSTAEVSAVSDPLPTIWHGVPLRVRSVTVNVDRPGFMLNPSGCGQKQVGGVFDSNRDATASTAAPFAASGCSGLSFEPNLTLALTGRKQVTTGKHPGVKAKVTQAGISEAGIEQAVVRLPKSLALDPNNAQALCEFADGTKPDLENHCPKGSIVGRARAKTPLLKNDLVGNVYFVKNVRIDPKTGNQIRTLPMIIVALRGEIAVNLRGESSTTKAGRLVNTFANVPDAPISQFNLNINGGSNGILAVTRTRKARINLCAGRHTAETEFDGHNGRRHDTDIRMKTPCTKRQVKKAKRAAAKARAGSKRR